jgi:hypothetical protein
MLGRSRSPAVGPRGAIFKTTNCLRHAGARMPLAGLPHANKYDRKDSPAEKEISVRTREHMRNEGSRRFKLYFSENRSKFARVRAICDCAWTQRAARAALIGGTRQNLCGLDSAGSTDVRSHFAFIDRTGTLSGPGGNFKGNTPSQRAARFVRALRLGHLRYPRSRLAVGCPLREGFVATIRCFKKQIARID